MKLRKLVWVANEPIRYFCKAFLNVFRCYSRSVENLIFWRCWLHFLKRNKTRGMGLTKVEFIWWWKLWVWVFAYKTRLTVVGDGEAFASRVCSSCFHRSLFIPTILLNLKKVSKYKAWQSLSTESSTFLLRSFVWLVGMSQKLVSKAMLYLEK